MSSEAGYSGTPLAKKLEIREGARVFVWDGPDASVNATHDGARR